MISNFEAGTPTHSCRGRLRPFNEVASFEAGACPDEGDEVGCVHGSPAGLGGLDELDTIARATARDPAPLVTLVRSRTVAKVDSLGLVVCT